MSIMGHARAPAGQLVDLLARSAIAGRTALLLVTMVLTGGPLAGSLLQPAMAQGAASGGQVTLNLKDADIEALIGTVSEVTGRNFIVDPRVKGKVTVISSTPMSGGDLYQVFLSILKVHGFAAVPSGQVIKIVPDANAKSDSIATMDNSGAARGDELVTRVIPIKSVSATQLVPILRPLIPQQGHLAAYQQSNVIIISDRAANVDRIVSIIARIDQVGNSKIDVIPLHHASAAEVVRIVNSLNSVAKAGAGGGPGSDLKMVADERTNSVLISGDLPGRLRIKAMIAHLDTPLESTGNTHVVYLHYANAKELVAVLTGVSDSLADSKLSPKLGSNAKKIARANLPGSQQTQIQADENLNALVITASPGVFRSLQAVIRQLDIRRAQVLVESVVAEISTDRAAELGIQWLFANNSTPVGVINFTNTGAPQISDLATQVAGSTGTTGTTATTSSFSFGSGATLGIIDKTTSILGRRFINVGALIKALNADADANVLSTPSLVTLDNTEAEIIVGQNVPFVTGSFTNTGANTGSTNPFQTIERQDVGITLKIKPQINEGNAIKLDINQEVSSVAPSTAGAADLTTNKRSIKTTVMVEDGQMLVLGGLIDEQSNESVQKVPLLGDLPLLGALFRSTSTSIVKRNLMVFLRPTILRDRNSENIVSSAKYNQFRARQLRKQERGLRLMRDKDVSVLPEMDEFMSNPLVRPGGNVPAAGVESSAETSPAADSPAE